MCTPCPSGPPPTITPRLPCWALDKELYPRLHPSPLVTSRPSLWGKQVRSDTRHSRLLHTWLCFYILVHTWYTHYALHTWPIWSSTHMVYTHMVFYTHGLLHTWSSTYMVYTLLKTLASKHKAHATLTHVICFTKHLTNNMYDTLHTCSIYSIRQNKI